MEKLGMRKTKRKYCTVEQTSKIVLTIVWKFRVRPDMNDEFKSDLQSVFTEFLYSEPYLVFQILGCS